MSTEILTQARLKELLHYAPDTGVFMRLVSTRNHIKVGNIAGATNGKGYRQIQIDGKMYLAHRLAWFYTHGIWPTNMLDHKNGTKGDDRIDNLREATRAQNTANRTTQGNNTSGYKGVVWCKRRKKWQTRIKNQGKQKHLGYFDTKEDAHAVYCAAAAQLQGEFANFG